MVVKYYILFQDDSYKLCDFKPLSSVSVCEHAYTCKYVIMCVCVCVSLCFVWICLLVYLYAIDLYAGIFYMLHVFL